MEYQVAEENGTSKWSSISFPPEIYRILGELAVKEKVSLAWAVRYAAEKYITPKWPLLRKSRT